ncbi:MAG: hypothetical protein ABMA64_10545 [Myxococcota bacterium]
MLSLVLALPASAFTPSGAVGPTLEPQRIRYQNAEHQGVLQTSPAWQRFLRTDGQGWQVRFDEATGAARYLWGRGIPMPSSETELVPALRSLLERHGELIGLDGAELSLKTANYNGAYDTYYVEFDALRDGTATYRGGVSARIKHGKLILLVVATQPDAPVTGAWTLPEADATALAIANGPAPGASHVERSVTPQLLEIQGAHGLELRRTFLVRTRTAEPPGIWVSFVDAESGALLSVHNEVRFVDGAVEADHHARTVDGSPLVTSPLPNVTVVAGGDSDVTDDNGEFTVNSAATYTSDLHGTYVYVNDAGGTDGTISSNDEFLSWTTGSSSATQAELDTYVFVHQVQAWGLEVEPNVGMVTEPFDANVNLGDVCNAYYDGYSINFFNAGSGCNNTGQIADVVYHEWGHGFHAWSIEAGIFDSSLSEGAADAVAFFQTADSEIGPYFFTSGPGIRDVAPNKVYPDDYDTYCYGGYCDPHANGLIFGGAIWDLWDLLEADLGPDDGKDVTEAIFAGLLKGGTGIDGTYLEAIAADDDDGDLANGTPHICQISEAFAEHGLAGFVGTSAAIPIHDPITFAPADLATPVQMEIVSAAPDCFPIVPASAQVYYRIDGGQTKSVNASVTGQDLAGDIPAQGLGTFVEYWVEGVDTDGATFRVPTAGEIAPYTFFVGDVIEIGCEDFEASDGGYTHELLDGTVEDGADDWMWGTPSGLEGDPSAAFSGNNVWGNDLGGLIDGLNYNGLYKPDKYNRLVSGPIDTLWYTDVFLQYRRWLNVEDGVFDQAVITVDDKDVWSNWVGAESDHHQDHSWMSHVVDLDGKADQKTRVNLAWELHSDPGLELAGWNIDDVCLYAPATPDNRLAIVDLVVEDTGGPITLSWTHPAHAPVERVVVTRRVDQYPTAWDDGDLLIDIPNPTPGEFTEAVHGNPDGASGYYAVYGFDGEDWLSWTIEGWNAGYAAPNDGGGTTGTGTVTEDGEVDTTPGDPGDGDEAPALDTGTKAAEGGCGCDTPAAPSLGGAALALALVVRRRRR